MNNIRTFEGMTPTIAEDAWVDEAAVVVGDVEIGSGSSIWPGVVVRGDIHHIRIGQRTSIQDGSVIHVTHASEFVPDGYSTTVGSDITVGHNVTLHGCEIKDRCLIGMGSIVLDGAIVASEVIVGAGSLVPGGKVLESGYLYIGSPVKQIRKLTEKEIAFFEYSARRYQALGQRHRNAQGRG